MFLCDMSWNLLVCPIPNLLPLYWVTLVAAGFLEFELERLESSSQITNSFDFWCQPPLLPRLLMWPMWQWQWQLWRWRRCCGEDEAYPHLFGGSPARLRDHFENKAAPACSSSEKQMVVFYLYLYLHLFLHFCICFCICIRTSSCNLLLFHASWEKQTSEE